MSKERSPRALCSTTIGISGMVGYPFDNWLVVNDNSNQMVVKGGDDDRARRGEDRGEPGGRDRGHARRGVRGARHRGGPRTLARRARPPDPDRLLLSAAP